MNAPTPIAINKARDVITRPNWTPLLNLAKAMPNAIAVQNFMFMGGYVLKDGTVVYTYKHGDTRRYLNLDSGGATYRYVAEAPGSNGGAYVLLSTAEAIAHVNS